MKAFFLFPTWLQLPALVWATLFQMQGSEWTLPKGFLTDGFQMEWIQIGRESPQSPWVVKFTTSVAEPNVTVFFRTVVVPTALTEAPLGIGPREPHLTAAQGRYE